MSTYEPRTETLPAAALLAEFAPATPADWRALVEAELKGAPFEARMVSKTPEGIDLRPLYHREDLAGLGHLGSLPGRAPFVRGRRAAGYHSEPWDITQAITVAQPADFNDVARAGLEQGLTALTLVLDRAARGGRDPGDAEPGEVGCGGVSIATLSDLERALARIDLAVVPLFMGSGDGGLAVGALLAALAAKRHVPREALKGCLGMDPLGVLAREGRLPGRSLARAVREMAAATAWAAAQAPSLRTIGVDARIWHESGASAVQELGFALATGVEYLREMSRHELAVEVVAPRIRFTYAVGTRFFMEIAKLRAARMLWARAVGAAGGPERVQCPSIHVRTSRYNKTCYDAHGNLLRTSVEAFAAVMGGCDALEIGTFDELRPNSDALSSRLARNQQLILREECGLAQVADPAGGSWFVESLTDDLARRAWELFQRVEQAGGMAKALAVGLPQQEVSRVAADRLDRVARRRDRVVGVTVYPDVRETARSTEVAGASEFPARRGAQVEATRAREEDPAFAALQTRLESLGSRESVELFEALVGAVLGGASVGDLAKALRRDELVDPDVEPLRFIRAAAGFETLRAKVDEHARGLGRRIRVLLSTLGPPKQHRARAEFSRSFLEIAGFEVVQAPGAATPELAAAEDGIGDAPAVCLCSTDETYPTCVPAWVAGIRARHPGRTVILAGYPTEHLAALREAGVDEFIHLRADALATLTSIARRLGVDA